MTPEQWHTVKELFAEALERDLSQRAAFLDEACDGDDAREPATPRGNVNQPARLFWITDVRVLFAL